MLQELRHEVEPTRGLHRADVGTNGRRYALSLPAVIDMNGFDRLEEVADLVMSGKSEYQIARALSIKVVEARSYMAQFQEIINNDVEARDAARDHLNKMVARYERLIERLYENLDDLNTMEYDEKVSAQINATLKNIADFDKTRVDLLQKAGLLDASDLGDELAEREEREALILDILKNDLCPNCQSAIRDKLTRLTGVVQGEVVDE